MKTTLYLVRHCESEGNSCRRSQAQFDGIVTRKGLRQADALAQRFADIPVTAVYSSDAYRSRMTAQPLADAKGLPVQLRTLLREYTIGIWEGMSIARSARQNPELYARWTATPYDHNIPGADQFSTVADRGCEAIQRLAKENPGGTVVAISHSCTINCTLTRLLGQPISYYGKVKSGDNTAVTKLEVDEEGNVEVIYINDDSHLSPELLRQNYTGRTPDTNFDFEYISFPQDDERFAAAVAQACEQLSDWNDAAEIRARVDESVAQHSTYAFFPVLLERVCGIVTVKRDPSLPADHGMLTGMFVPDDLRTRGYTEQAFGEAIDVLRRRGCRYLVVENKNDPHFQLLIGRFIFEPMPGSDTLMRMKLTVPGVEGPLYG
ncbi:MAG: hypothetical protein E7469_02255 [Ruminococcaceae bacterium]|nr:hypothetical protein [Oscillospiraceae bacterium]